MSGERLKHYLAIDYRNTKGEKPMKSVFYRQIIFVILLLLAFILVVGALFLSNSALAAVVDDEGDSKKMLKRYNDEQVSIDVDDQIYADIFIADGTITIQGEVFGDVVAIWSNVEIKRQSRIYGNVCALSSSVALRFARSMCPSVPTDK